MKSQTWLNNFTFTFHFHALEKEMATHSSVLAWRLPGTVEPGGLPSMGSHRVGHDWSDLVAAAAAKGRHSILLQSLDQRGIEYWLLGLCPEGAVFLCIPEIFECHEVDSTVIHREWGFQKNLWALKVFAIYWEVGIKPYLWKVYIVQGALWLSLS